MHKPVVVTISHSMGRAQALASLRDRIGAARGMLDTYRVALVKEEWDGDRLSVELRALGQSARAMVDVMDEQFRIEIQLPWLLAAFADKVRAVVEQKAPTLLGPPGRRE